MGKKKRSNRPGQRKGDAHYTPPKPSGFVPPNNPPTPPDVQEGGANEPENETQELTEAVDRHVRMNTWFAGAIMIATVVQAVVTCFQWQAMDRGLKQTDDVIEQMQLERRPWLYLTVSYFGPVEPGNIDTAVSIKNSGDTPGYIDEYKIITFVRPPNISLDDLIEQFESVPAQPAEAFIVPPNEFIDVAQNIQLTSEDEAKLRAGTDQVYMFCLVTYRDAAGGSKHETVCYFTEFEGSTTLITGSGYGKMD